MDPEISDWRSLTIKHAGKCSVCGSDLPVGAKALWSPTHHLVKCAEHSKLKEAANPAPLHDEENSESNKTDEPLSQGTPGGSALAKAQHLSQSRKERITKRYPRAGKFILAVTDDPQSTQAWVKGAQGEIGAAKELEKLASKYNFRVLHDRRVPNSQANIDHIAITRSGIYVVDAKNYEGLIKIVDNSGIFSDPHPKLWVGGRSGMHLVDGVKKQVEVVKRVLRDSPVNMSVRGVIAFYRGEWEPFSSLMPQEVVQGILINNKGIDHIVTLDGNYSQEQIEVVTHLLAGRLRPAS